MDLLIKESRSKSEAESLAPIMTSEADNHRQEANIAIHCDKYKLRTSITNQLTKTSGVGLSTVN